MANLDEECYNENKNDKELLAMDSEENLSKEVLVYLLIIYCKIC